MTRLLYGPFQNPRVHGKMKLTLQCAIVGQTGSSFDVKIEEGQTVGDLKEAIAVDQKFGFAASKLQLFLAKQPVEDDDGKEVVPVYHPCAEGMKKESFKWLPDKHRAALKLVKGESDDYINSLTAGEPILASKTLTIWLYEKNNMEDPSTQQFHVLVVVPERVGGQQVQSILSHNPLMRIEENYIRMFNDMAAEIRERYRKQAEENRERDRKQAELFSRIERALNPPPPSKSDEHLGLEYYQQLVDCGCVSRAEEKVGEDAFWSVEDQAKANSTRNEYEFDAFITAYFNDVLDSLDVVFVNSERYKWLPQSKLPISKTELKPHGFVTHRGMYLQEDEPNDTVVRRGTFRFGKATKALFDCLILFESNTAKSLKGTPFGQVARYIQHVFPQGRGSAVLFNKTTFWLINSINGGVVRVDKATWIMEGSKALFRDFISMNLSPWVKRLTAARSAFNVEVVEGDAFLGRGAFGRVFKVKRVGQDGDVLALKIVETSSAGRLFREVDALVLAQDTSLTIRPVGAATAITDGAAVLLSPVGETIPYPTTNEEVRALFEMLWQLHSVGLVHGDPRVPNVIVKNGQRLWIDIVEWTNAFPILKRNDAEILTQSILHVFPKDSLDSELMTLINNYGENPTKPNLDLLAVKVGETLAAR